MSVKLDLSKFKHVSSDHKTTRLKHQDGHFLVLSHKNLGKDSQDQLAALAKGGMVKKEKLEGMSEQGKDLRHGEKQLAKDEARGRAVEERHVRPNIKGLAEGGDPEAPKPKKYSEAEDETVMNHRAADGTMSHRRPDPMLHPNENNQGGWGQAARELPGDLVNVAKDAGRDIKKLAGYAEGGKAQMPAQADKKQYDQTEKPVHNQWHGIDKAIENLNPMSPRPKMAEGGEPIPNYAQPVPAPQPEPMMEEMPQEASPEQQASSGDDHDAVIQNAFKSVVANALKGSNKPPQGQAPPSIAMKPGMPGAEEQAPPAAAAPPQPKAAMPPQQAAPAVPEAQMSAPAVQPMDPQSPAPVTPAAPMPQAGGPNQMPTQQAPVQDYANLKQGLQQQYIEEDQAWAHDLNNGHITPKTYSDLFHYNKDGSERSTLSKIGSIFGMLLSGAGSGLAHQENAALKMMDNVISRDIEAQKTNKSNAAGFNLLNQQRIKQVADIQKMKQDGQLSAAQAANLTQDAILKADTLQRMRANRAALHSLVMEVSKFPVGSPQRQQAEQALAMVSQGVDAQNFNLADVAASKSALFAASAASADQANPEAAFQHQQRMLRMQGQEKLAQDNEARHAPVSTGMIGQASKPLSPDAEESINSGASYESQLHHFIEWAKTHSGSVDPTEIKYGMALAAELQGAYRQATKGGVYKEGEQNFISKLIHEKPTVFFNKIRVLPALKALQDTHHAKMNQLARNNGFKGYDYRQVVGKPQAEQQIKVVNGIKYMRGPDGNAIKVK